jgi:hypothetical protein
MESPSIEPRAETSIPVRILLFVAGLLVLGIGVLISLGAALAGAIVVGIAAWMMKRKNQSLTRRGAWLASVGGTIAVMAVFTGVAVLTSNATPPTAAQRAEQRARANEAMPSWLKSINPNAQKQSEVADSMAARLLDNRAVMIWAGLMGAVIASAMIGAIAGSFAWGGVMLLYRAFHGAWMRSGPVTEPVST